MKALDEFISRRVGTDEHQNAIHAYLERARAQAAAVSPEGFQSSAEPPEASDERESAA